MTMGRILLLCLLGAALLSTACGHSSTGPDDCCFKFYPKKLPLKFFRSYYETDHRCPKPAVILVTRKSNICADPSASWVQTIMRSLDEKLL